MYTIHPLYTYIYNYFITYNNNNENVNVKWVVILNMFIVVLNNSMFTLKNSSFNIVIVSNWKHNIKNCHKPIVLWVIVWYNGG